MMTKSKIRCETPRCKKSIENHGEMYHMVSDVYRANPDFMPDAIVTCDHCGGYFNGDVWAHICASCGETVEAGKLTGLFVPHLCETCEKENAEKDKKAGRVCFRCRAPYSRCCC